MLSEWIGWLLHNLKIQAQILVKEYHVRAPRGRHFAPGGDRTCRIVVSYQISPNYLTAPCYFGSILFDDTPI